MRLAILSAIALLAPWAIAQEQAKAPDRQNFTIVGARIVVGNGKVIENGSVVVKDGKITDVSAMAPIVDPATVVIQGAGVTVYPGFIDACRTTGVKPSPDPSQEGKPKDTETAPASMWVGNRKGIAAEWRAADNLDFSPDEAAYKAGITTAMFCPSRGSIRGIAGVVSLLPSTVNTRVLNSDFGMGMSFRSGTGQGYPGNILGVVALMRQTLYDAKALGEGTELSNGSATPSWIKTLEALSAVVTGHMPVVFEANMEREIQRALRLGDEFGYKTVLAGCRDGYLMADTLAKRQIPVILTAGLSPEPSLEAPANSVAEGDRTPMGYRQDRHDLWEQQSKTAEALFAAKVTFAFSSEGGGAGDLLTNVRKLIQRGLPKDAALRALTLDAATLLGVGAQTGSIEVGKRADLILMNGDFANDKTAVKRVWIDGRPVFEAKEGAN